MSKKGFIPIITPDLTKSDIISACGFNPRDTAEQLFMLQNDRCLVGTSEVTLANLHANQVLSHNELPKKYAGFSHCFRMEAGRGAASKGLMRMH